MSTSMIVADVATVVIVPLVFWLIAWEIRMRSERHTRRGKIVVARTERALEEAAMNREILARVRDDLWEPSLAAIDYVDTHSRKVAPERRLQAVR